MKGITFTLILAGFVSIGVFQMRLFEQFEKNYTNHSDAYVAKVKSVSNPICERPASYPVCSTDQLFSNSTLVQNASFTELDSLELFANYSEVLNDDESIYQILFAKKKKKSKPRKKVIFPQTDFKPIELNVIEGELFKITGLDSSSVELRKAMVLFAKQFVHYRYRYGGREMNGFDCSGFTGFIYENVAGIKIPRSSFYQSKVGITISKESAKAGDLVFFGSRRGGSYRTSHVGMVISSENGRLKVIHSARGGVRIDDDILEIPHYKRRFLFVKRLF